MKPILLIILIVYCLGFIIAGFYMRYKKNRKAAGNTYIVAGLLGALFGMVYHFFFT
ncbi:hypothetical protein MPH47_21225 [Psychrobacillus psychrodurans]|uniref:hypothetical protein n=1 Tax=Psychrobacillus psychrodurans TaxID=126157 RepID=UPI001F4D3713|nr:hypothetical protein [Psychrobacillus psychrodurans]MCK1999713.1 hypothetical protein [Psychrobacillus psychrodurans]